MKISFQILFVLFALILFGCVKDLDRDNPLDSYANDTNNSSGTNTSEEESGLFVESFDIISDNNGDLKVNKGESIKLSVKIKNGTSMTINKVRGTISCSNEYVLNMINAGPKSFFKDGFSSYYDYILAGSWGKASSYNYLEFDVSESAPDDIDLEFDIELIDQDGNIWNDTFVVSVVSTNSSLSVQGFTIKSDNNGDLKVNKGETIQLSVSLQNSGSSQAIGVKGEISSSSPYVSNMLNVGPSAFSENGSSYSNYISPGGLGNTSSYNYLEFDVSEDAPIGAQLTFSIKITDESGNIWNDTFVVIVGAIDAKLSVQGFTIKSDNNGDEKVNKGETIKLSIKLQNSGLSKAVGVKGEISSTSPYVSNIINAGSKSFYQNGSSYSNYINSGSLGETSSYNYLEFDVSENTPIGTEVSFSVKITDESGNIWNDTFKFTVVSTGASLSVQNYTIESDNNGDSKVNKGESIELFINIQNTGSSKANGVKGEISCSSPYVSNIINKGPKSFYQNGSYYSNYISPGNLGKTSSYNYLEFDVSPSAPFGNLTFNITITDESNNIWYDSFNVTVE